MERTVYSLLEQADQEHFAVPAFNFSDIWELEAIIEAAEEMRSPVMIATNAQVVKTHGLAYLAALGRTAAKEASVPVVLHLDHCREEAGCLAALQAGYPSVMIDRSDRPLEENICSARLVADAATQYSAGVEAEIGRIRGRGAEGVYEGEEFLADVSSAVRIAAESGVASLAVGIGNAHGFYSSRPKLNFRRLEEINEAVSIPLVLHGGTGIPVEDVQRAIRLGINKVNIGTQLHYRYLTTLRQMLAEKPDCLNVPDIMTPVREAIREDVRTGIRTCMSEGRC